MGIMRHERMKTCTKTVTRRLSSRLFARLQQEARRLSSNYSEDRDAREAHYRAVLLLERADAFQRSGASNSKALAYLLLNKAWHIYAPHHGTTVEFNPHYARNAIADTELVQFRPSDISPELLEARITRLKPVYARIIAQAAR